MNIQITEEWLLYEGDSPQPIDLELGVDWVEFPPIYNKIRSLEDLYSKHWCAVIGKPLAILDNRQYRRHKPTSSVAQGIVDGLYRQGRIIESMLLIPEWLDKQRKLIIVYVENDEGLTRIYTNRFRGYDLGMEAALTAYLEILADMPIEEFLDKMPLGEDSFYILRGRGVLPFVQIKFKT